MLEKSSLEASMGHDRVLESKGIKIFKQYRIVLISIEY